MVKFNRKEKTHLYSEPTARIIVLTMILAFVIPVVIMVFAFAKVQIWPGGKFTVLIYDLLSQFGPVISSLRYLGMSDNSFFYSFYGALGNNAFLNYAAYILDPMVWIIAFFSLEHMPTAIYFITLIKIGLCGVGVCSYFLFGSKSRRYPFFILTVSVCYALMSYNIVYSECLLWYNVVMLTPIILLGIEGIIAGKRGGIYVLCMTLSLYYNAQLSYMVGIFAIMYLIYRLSEISKNRIRVILRFVICNILCAGLFMPVALPVMYNILNGRMQSYNYLTGTFFYYPVWKVVKQFLSCQYSTIESGGLPSLFCGTFVPIIAVTIFLLPIKQICTKIIAAMIIIFFIFSFCFVPLNQFWHGFNEPNSYPARYSFLLCLFLLILFYQVLCFVFEKIWLSKSGVYSLYGTVMLITALEMYLNTGYILTSLNLEMRYLIDSEYQFQTREMKTALNNIEDENFYRIGKDIPFTYNDGMLFGFNGVGYFSSMFERNTMEFIGKLGYSQNEHVLTGIGGTPLSESLLGIRYKVLREPELFGYYENMDSKGSFSLQYNEHALPLGFLMKYRGYDPSDDKEIMEGLKDHNAFAYQKLILSELAGADIDAYENIEYSIEDINSEDFGRYVKMKFIVTSERPVWIYCKDLHDGFRVIAPNNMKKNKSSSSTTISTTEQQTTALLKVNGEPRYPFVDGISTMCIYLGTFKRGEEVEVEAACVNSFDDPWIAYYNYDECNSALDTIKQTGLRVTEHKNGKIKGKIKVRNEDDLMVMTLPAMRGYRVRVDGNRAEYGAYRDALFALKMAPGEHVVEISFIPYGLIPGSVLGMIFLVSSVLYFRRFEKKTV